VPDVTNTKPAAGTRVLLLEGIHPDARSAFEAVGCEVTSLERALDEDELVEQGAGYHLLGIRSKTQVTEKVLAGLPDLVAIGAFCIGTNQIDVAGAGARGIAVFNAPFSNTRSVVELALAEIIAMTRRLTEKDRGMHAGVWDKTAAGLHEVRGRTLGIIGYGNIGTQLSVLAENLGMDVLFFDTADRLPLGNARPVATLEELLGSVDVVTLHVDGRAGNSGFFGEDEFALMRPGSIFLNLSRGFVVDQEALRRHLESGHLSGAAIDVFPEEPKGRGDRFVSPLQGMANVILTPHIGGSTEEAQQDIGRFVAGKLRDYVLGGGTALSINFPGLIVPERVGAVRLVHIHRNTPGVLAAINAVFAAEQVNIDGQTLGTRGEIGYVITDLGAVPGPRVIEALQNLPETIRLRQLD
jgi:D-3-phosphoglycerate dehydrogenase / 2-oxoglutarate reductase